jgi:hypothetical protein
MKTIARNCLDNGITLTVTEDDKTFFFNAENTITGTNLKTAFESRQEAMLLFAIISTHSSEALKRFAAQGESHEAPSLQGN